MQTISSIPEHNNVIPKKVFVTCTKWDCILIMKFILINARKGILRKGNVLACVCNSVHGWYLSMPPMSVPCPGGLSFSRHGGQCLLVVRGVFVHRHGGMTACGVIGRVGIQACLANPPPRKTQVNERSYALLFPCFFMELQHS